MITLFPWFSKIKYSAIPSKANFFRLELPQTRINTTEKEAFASLIPMMHGMRESNPRLLFWREVCYHYTNPAKYSPRGEYSCLAATLSTSLLPSLIPCLHHSR